MAKTLLYLQEHDLADYEELASKVADASGHCDVLTAKIRAAEQRMAEINTLKTHIINYAHTREIFAAYKSPATSNTSWQSMRKKSGSTGRPRKRSTRPAFRSCPQSRAYKRNSPSFCGRRNRSMPSFIRSGKTGTSWPSTRPMWSRFWEFSGRSL